MKPVILIGFMGSGKSTIGKNLANKLNLELKEMDQLIEERLEMSIAKLFETKGEDFFRNVEHHLLKEVISSEGVIATGGGVIVHEKNQEILQNSDQVIYLNGQIETLYERITQDKINNRPLADSVNQTELLSLLTTRKKDYEKAANLIVNIDEKTVDEITQEILIWLREEAQ